MRPAVRGAAVRVALPDVEITIEDQIAEGDKVLSRMMLHGTHLGEYGGALPTGKQVTFGALAYVARLGKRRFVVVDGRCDE